MNVAAHSTQRTLAARYISRWAISPSRDWRGPSSTRYIAMRTSAPPASVLGPRYSPPRTTAKMPAKTGSIVIMTAVCVGVSSVCTQVWMRNANAVANTAVTITATHAIRSGGSMMPPGMAATPQITATTPSWTIASEYGSRPADHSPRPTMWIAKNSAQPRVSSSPGPTANPRSEISAMTITEDRGKEVIFSEPYINSNQSITATKGSGIKALADLKGKIVGVQSGTTGEAWARENVADAKEIKSYDTALDAFTALQAGQIVAVINDLPVSAFIVKDKPELEIVEEIATDEQYGIAVGLDNTELAEAINKALQELKADGTYDEIHAKWFGTTE